MNEMQRATGAAIVLITHDLGVVAEVCKNVLVMYGGNMVEYGTAEQIFTIRACRTRRGCSHRFRALDDSEHRRLVPIKGQPPNLLRLPPGCAFAPRCTYRMPICAEPVPLVRFRRRPRRAVLPLRRTTDPREASAQAPRGARGRRRRAEAAWRLDGQSTPLRRRRRPNDQPTIVGSRKYFPIHARACSRATSPTSRRSTT